MHWIDWSVVAVFLVSMILVGVYFSRRAGENVDSFFVSGRTLKWYVAGASMIATGFAADTPLWVGSLVRQYGIHACWQYWTPMIGAALAVALFSRMWRRTEIVTDAEIVELRYSGKSASALRGISAGVGALILCPLIIGWVAKAMVTIAQEALGIGGHEFNVLGATISSEMLATMIVMACAVLMCAFSGLYGVVYTDFVQFIIATIGAFLLAYLSVKEVGGLKSMIEQLSANKEWLGHGLKMTPEITFKVSSGGQGGAMSIWNAIGFFGILWWGNALCGAYQAQRVLACKNTRHASNAVLMHTVVYFGIICWPWIVVALASLIVFPDMGESGHDAAYPRMLLHILPIGLRGIMVSAMIAAFISTISTLFNWGSSYIVNDLYRRFIHRKATDKHYVRVSRLLTFMVAIGGGIISFHADNIQQLLSISYVISGGAMVVGACRWFWWRVNAQGEVVAFVVNWTAGSLMLFGHKLFGLSEPLLDGTMTKLLGLEDGVSFTNDYDMLGARMLLLMIVGLLTVISVSLATPAVDKERLKEFVMRTRIFEPGWRAVTREIPGYHPAQTVRVACLDWLLVLLTVGSLLFAMSNVVRYRPLTSVVLFAAFGVLLTIVIRRTRKECPVDDAKEESAA